MKSFLYKTGISLSILFLVTNCGLIKNKMVNKPVVTLQKPEISDYEEVYIPQQKSEKKKISSKILQSKHIG